MELLLVDLCKDTVLKRPTPATTTTAGAVFDVPTFGLFRSKNRPNLYRGFIRKGARVLGHNIITVPNLR